MTCRHTTALLVAVASAAALTASCAARRPVPYPILEQSHVDVRARMLAHVGEALFPYWLEHGIDEEYGGFLTELNRDGSVRGGRKMLVAQARQVWTFSRMWNAGYHDPRIARGARQGLDFLRAHFWDEEHDGWFWQVARDGTPDDMTKKVYGHAFVIYAAVEYYRAFGDAEALALAGRTFDTLERHAKDPENPGYIDFMDRLWQPDMSYNGHVKTMNTHLHLMEALTELYLTTGERRHRDRLREVFDILTRKCYLEEHGCCIDGFYYDWTPALDGYFGERSTTTSYGHNVEFAWLMQRTVDALGLPRDYYRQMGLRMIDRALENGWDEETGALYYEGPLEGPATNLAVEWWTQGENAVALDWAWRTTGEPRYLDALCRQVDWILRHQADPVYGGWFSTLNADGSRRTSEKAGIWHAGYHEVRTCLNVGTGEWE